MILIQDLGMLPDKKGKIYRAGIYECEHCKVHFQARTSAVKFRNQKYCRICAQKISHKTTLTDEDRKERRKQARKKYYDKNKKSILEKNRDSYSKKVDADPRYKQKQLEKDRERKRKARELKSKPIKETSICVTGKSDRLPKNSQPIKKSDEIERRQFTISEAKMISDFFKNNEVKVIPTFEFEKEIKDLGEQSQFYW